MSKYHLLGFLLIGAESSKNLKETCGVNVKAVIYIIHGEGYT